MVFTRNPFGCIIILYIKFIKLLCQKNRKKKQE